AVSSSEALAGCGKSLNRDDSPPQGLKPSLILHDLRGAKAPLYHSAAGFRDFFRSLLERGRLVICFFRGRWCPFCVGQLEAMNRIVAELRKAEATLMAIPPKSV